MQLPNKHPDGNEAYSFDFIDRLDAGETISSVTIEVVAGTIAASIVSFTSTTVTFRISGGEVGELAQANIIPTTSLGDVEPEPAYIFVTEAPTSTTKRALIEQAFAECRINAWELDITPEEKNAALTRLDALMWELRGRGYELAYNYPAGIGQGELDDELGCADQAFFGLATLLAERLAGPTGKTQSRETRMALNAAMKAVINAAPTLVPTSELASGTPLGSGNRSTLRLRFA